MLIALPRDKTISLFNAHHMVLHTKHSTVNTICNNSGHLQEILSRRIGNRSQHLSKTNHPTSWINTYTYNKTYYWIIFTYNNLIVERIGKREAPMAILQMPKLVIILFKIIHTHSTQHKHSRVQTVVTQ